MRTSELRPIGFAPALRDLLDFGRSATRVMKDTALKAALKSSKRAQFSLNYFSGQSWRILRGHFFEFGPFRVDVANLLLFRDGQPLSLAPKAVETPIPLVQHGGQLVKKDDLIRIVWSDLSSSIPTD